MSDITNTKLRRLVEDIKRRSIAPFIGERWSLYNRLAANEILELLDKEAQMQQEEVTEIPLIYPLVSITIKSVSIVDGNRVLHECEAVVNVHELQRHGQQHAVVRLVTEFKNYVRDVIKAAKSQQARVALQNIRDKQTPDSLPNPTDRPS